MGAKTKKMYPAKAQLKKRTQFPSNKFEAEQRLKKSKAAKKGWNTKRAKQQAAQQGAQSVNYHHVVGDIKEGKITATTYSSTSGEVLNKVQGKITETAQKNEDLSMKLGANVWALLSALKSKFLGYTPISIGGEIKEHSSAQILGAQERTEENLESCLKMIEELHKLQEEML